MKTLRAEAGWTIGALAERTGCNVPTIRYYEEIGLIPLAKRRPSGHRYYDAAAKELLTFIRHCREFGFPIEQVRELVSLARSDERDCFETKRHRTGSLEHSASQAEGVASAGAEPVEVRRLMFANVRWGTGGPMHDPQGPEPRELPSCCKDRLTVAT